MNKLFTIYKVDSEEAAIINAAQHEAHQHDFEELVIAVDGEVEHFIDFQTTNIEAPLVSFVTKGKLHRLLPKVKDGKCDIWVIRFKSEFIPETTFQLYTYYHNHATIKLSKGSCFNRLVLLCEMIQTEYQQAMPDLSVVRHLLSALFIMIESERNKISQVESLPTNQNTTLQNFLQILEENFRRPVGVDYYAEKLFMSPRNLNRICKDILQQTVSEIIETRKLIEAKNQLTHTDKNISEIGFDLGYNEKSYFTNVFKKRTGQTPTEFRDEMKLLLT